MIKHNLRYKKYTQNTKFKVYRIKNNILCTNIVVKLQGHYNL